MREYHVRFCERLKVKFLRSTHLGSIRVSQLIFRRLRRFFCTAKCLFFNKNNYYCAAGTLSLLSRITA